MKKIFIIIFLLLSLLSFSKDYKIGDKIALKINGDITKTDLEKDFNDYKVYKIEKNKDHYVVIFTTYKVGENIIKIGDTDLKFNVISTITDKDKDIYTDFENSKNIYVVKDYPYLSIVTGIFGLLIVIVTIIKHLIDRSKDPYVVFNKAIKRININNWREEISLATRRFIDNVFNTNFLGGDYQANKYITDEDLKFLKDLDLLKYSKNTDGDMEFYKSKSIEIINRIKQEVKKDDNI